MLQTSIPSGEVDRFVDLALKAKSQKISTVSLVPPLVPNTADPDIARIHRAVDTAITKSEGTASDGPGKKRKPKSETVTGGSLGDLSDGYRANQTADLATAC